eukprot:TRINITY_DN17122_c0_g1_i1.p1 TRINITY_DN17122_c0_g1~~TRINITY_DN17122_c0_g1_i1.p1  ORF type:complete len:372 (+),score=75.90 TRINITY_DN17122_c0_g1_i1:77-1192(+)
MDCAAGIAQAFELLSDKSSPWESGELAACIAGTTALDAAQIREFQAAGGLRALAAVVLHTDGVVDPGFAYAVAVALGHLLADVQLRGEWAAYNAGEAASSAAALCAGLLAIAAPPDGETVPAELHAAAAACLSVLPLPPAERVALGLPKRTLELLSDTSFASGGSLLSAGGEGAVCSADAAMLLALAWAESPVWTAALCALGLPTALCRLCGALSESDFARPELQPMLLRLCCLLLALVESPAYAGQLDASDGDRKVRDWFCHRIADRSAGGSPHFGVRSAAQQLRAQWEGSARGSTPRGTSFAVGERVLRKAGRPDQAPADGAPQFYLLDGEAATVVELDGDGDIRLADPRGRVSTSFRRSKFFCAASPE